MALRKFKTNTRSQFIDPETNKWVQLGNWRPTAYCYEWHGDYQLLIVSYKMSVTLFGKTISMMPTSYNGEEFSIKDMEHLEKPGTYYRRRKAKA